MSLASLFILSVQVKHLVTDAGTNSRQIKHLGHLWKGRQIKRRGELTFKTVTTNQLYESSIIGNVHCMHILPLTQFKLSAGTQHSTLII